MTTSNLNALNANTGALNGNPELIGTGLPNIGELTNLANELFRSLPCDGSRIAAVQQAAPEIPSSHQSYTDPAIVQLAAPSSGNVPKLAHVDTNSPGSNYYFLEALESHGKSAKTRDFGSIRSPAGIPGFGEQSLLAGVSAQEFGVPNAIDWQTLSKPRFDNTAIPGGVTHVPHSAGSASTVGGAPDFYFLQHAHAPETAPQLKELDTKGHRTFDVNAVRRDFPILQERVNGHQLVWFDNAATTQKPNAVIDRISAFYQHENSNIHRAAHTLAARSTDAYEKARDTVARFIHAPSAENIIFVRGTTEAINLVAQTWGRQNIQKDDEIVISWLEHHANIVPWQMLCKETGAKLRVAPVDDDGQIILSEYQKLLTSKTKLVSFTQVSNALGTVTPAQTMIELAQRAGAKVLLDGAQSVSHLGIDVQALGADWFVFSGHKIFGPTGIGVVYGKADLLESMPPWQGGGNMIEDVTFEKTIYQPAPARFEAGTGNIADAVGLGAALEYVERLGIANIARYEHELLLYGIESLSRINGLRLIGTADDKTSVLSFVLNGYTTQEIGETLNREGIAVRSGHHCAQPILRRFGLEATVRPSIAFYNTHEEIDRLADAIRQIKSARDF